MGGLEEGKVIPSGYTKRLAREAIGWGNAQRTYDNLTKSSIYDGDRVAPTILAGVGGAFQIMFPITSADLSDRSVNRREDPNREATNLEIVKFFGLALPVLALDLGIDAMALIMAFNGNVNAAIATKLAHNIAGPVISDKIIKPFANRIISPKKT